MRTKLFLLLAIFFGTQIGQAFACAVCMGGNNPRTGEHIAAAVWVMVGVIGTVFGGVGAFTFKIWRHSHAPLEPHQQLVAEDFAQYE